MFNIIQLDDLIIFLTLKAVKRTVRDEWYWSLKYTTEHEVASRRAVIWGLFVTVKLSNNRPSISTEVINEFHICR